MTDTPEAHSDLPEYDWTALIVKESEDPDSHDITRELAVMFDLVVGSLDWGSGMLDQEDVEALFRVAKICGFDPNIRYGISGHAYFDLLDVDGEQVSRAGQASPYLTARGEEWHYGVMGHRNGVARSIRFLEFIPRREQVQGGPEYREKSTHPLPDPIKVTANKLLTGVLPFSPDSPPQGVDG